jgi:hypothetical protein
MHWYFAPRPVSCSAPTSNKTFLRITDVLRQYWHSLYRIWQLFNASCDRLAALGPRAASNK